MSIRHNTITLAMQTNDPDYLFQTTSELSNAERRERKLKAAEKVGDPIKVSSKVLDLLVDDQLAWTAESGWQARKINLAVRWRTLAFTDDRRARLPCSTRGTKGQSRVCNSSRLPARHPGLLSSPRRGIRLSRYGMQR